MINTIRAELFKFYFDIKRYLFNYIVGVIANAIFLGGIYWGVRDLFTRSGTGTAFMGLLLWLFAPSAISEMINHLTEERYIGTLERISITKSPITHILTARVIVNFLFTLFDFILIGSILYIIFHPGIGILFSSLKVSVITLVTGLLIIVALYGFGLFVASLGMIFKRVGAIGSILEYLILFFSGIIVPWQTMPPLLKSFSNILPMTWGIRTLDGLQSGTYFLNSLVHLIFYTIIIMLIGIISLSYSIKVVKKRGEYSFY